MISYFILGLVLITLLLSYYFAAKVIFPRKFPLEKTYQIEIEKGKLIEDDFLSWNKQDVNIQSPFGYKLAAQYFPLQGSRRSVIISHGVTYTRFGSVKYMPLFRKMGFNILIYDLRYHGKSGGKNCTFGCYEKKDLVAITDWVFQQSGEGSIVGTMGESMGAAISLQHAAIDPRLSFVISDCSFSDLYSQLRYRLKASYPWIPVFIIPLSNLISKLVTGMAFFDIEPIQDIKKISAPTMIIHSCSDSYIPCSMGEALFENKINGYRQKYFSPLGDHAEAFWCNQSEYEHNVRSFFEEIGVITK